MAIFNRLLSLFVVFLERIKGGQTFVRIDAGGQDISHLVGQSFADYEIHIYCQRKQYCRVYHRWSALNRHFVIYHVFSVVSANAPGDIIQACKLEIDIPAQLPLFVDDSLQRISAISAYLDLVIARMSIA